MNTIDWKEALGKAFDVPVNEETTTPQEEPADKGDALTQQGKTRLQHSP